MLLRSAHVPSVVCHHWSLWGLHSLWWRETQLSAPSIGQRWAAVCRDPRVLWAVSQWEGLVLITLLALKQLGDLERKIKQNNRKSSIISISSVLWRVIKGKQRFNWRTPRPLSGWKLWCVDAGGYDYFPSETEGTRRNYSHFSLDWYWGHSEWKFFSSVCKCKHIMCKSMHAPCKTSWILLHFLYMHDWYQQLCMKTSLVCFFSLPAMLTGWVKTSSCALRVRLSSCLKSE